MIRPLLGQTYVSLFLFTTFALAALRNVTIDDSVLTGAVVPQYLSSGSLEWNQGNTCKTCAAQPDPAIAYNGTWHDASYSLQVSGSFRSFEFSFAGTALYIYFILANAPNIFLSASVTSVNFTLDGVTLAPFVHFPTPGAAGYQYNVPVFATESLASGTHTMTVQPVVPTSALNDSVLMLFDYLIYSTDAENVTTTTMLPVTTVTKSSANPSSSTSLASTSPVMSGTSSGPDVGAIVGGTVTGIIVVAVVVTSLLCYWRYKRRVGGYSHVAPFVSSRIAPTPFDASPPLIHQMQVGFSPSQPVSGSKTRRVTPDVTVQPSVPPSSTPPSAPGGSSNNVTALIEEIGMLRSEVARLRTRQDRERNLAKVGLVAPPDYF